MSFPEYFNSNTNYRTLKGYTVTCVEYFHQLGTIKDMHLSVENIFYIYVKSGEVKLQSPNETYTIKAGFSAIVNSGNYIMSESLSDKKGAFKAYLFFFSKESLKQFHYKNINEELSMIDSVNNVILIDECEFLDQLTQSVALFFNGEYLPKIKKDLVDLKSSELLHYLSINTLCSKVNKMLYAAINDDDDDYILKNVVQNNYLNNLSLKEYAFKCNMSLSNFKRKFRVAFGTPPAKWIKNKRLEYSLKLLESGQYKINQIAYKSGFNNPKTYRRLFKEKYKMLPSTFLKQP